MRVVFLDIDGVMNSKLWDEKNQENIQNGILVDEEKFALLKNLVDQTQAVIVMHSGWRIWFDENLCPVRKEAEILCRMLEKNGLRIESMTPDLTTEEIRDRKAFSTVKPMEILGWLETHPEVKQYVVIDDIRLNHEEIIKHQVQPDGTIGMTDEDVKRAVEILEEGSFNERYQGVL